MAEFFQELFSDLYENFQEFFKGFLVTIIVMIAGIIISWFIKKVIEKLLAICRFDKWSQNVGIVHFLEKGGVESAPSKIVGKILFWLLVVVFLSFALEFVGITQLKEYTTRIFAVMPLIVVSIIIIVIGIILSNFIGRLIYLACENANIKYGEIISKSVRIFLVLITFGIVFEYIGVGNTIVTISFLIVFGGIVLALSLALGIGLSHVIGDFIRDYAKNLVERHKDEDKHHHHHDY